MFNPDARVVLQPIAVDDGPPRTAVVVDDFLLDPAAIVAVAQRSREAFVPSDGNAFPGPELPLPDGVMQVWADVLMAHAGEALALADVRRSHGRLSLLNTPPDDLSPLQRLCHRDRLAAAPGEVPVACVVYLFADRRLGGTAFYAPHSGRDGADAVIRRAMHDGHAWLDAELGPGKRYMTTDSPWFRRTAVLAPAFNRAVFYRGDAFHSAHIERPDLIADDVLRGRLTMNAFFVCGDADAA